jgi:outer membrane lipoprotein SlyB
MRDFLHGVVVASLGFLSLSAIASNLDSQSRSLLQVSTAVWASLNSQQRDLVSAQYIVEVAEAGRFAKIVNVQGVNESTPGTTGGANLGSALGQAQYIDKANWSNYSARSQIGAGLVGAIIGSALDAPARAMHRIVYTLRSPDGTVSIVEKVSQSPIYVAPGLCVDTLSFSPVRDSMCEDGMPPEIRAILGQTEKPAPPPIVKIAPDPPSVPATPHPAAIPSGNLILCRFGSTSSVATSAEKCMRAGGTVQ